MRYGRRNGKIGETRRGSRLLLGSRLGGPRWLLRSGRKRIMKIGVWNLNRIEGEKVKLSFGAKPAAAKIEMALGGTGSKHVEAPATVEPTESAVEPNDVEPGANFQNRR